MIKSIKLHQARELINQRNVNGLFYVDKVSDKACPEIIFKSDLNDQLYSFYYCDDDPDLGITIDDDNLDVVVAPVKKVTLIKYERGNSND